MIDDSMHCDPEPDSIEIRLTAGQCAVTVTASILQIVNSMLLATRSVDELTHPGRDRTVIVSEVMKVPKELLPQLIPLINKEH